MAEKILRLQNVIYEYASDDDGERIRAVDGVSFDVEKGSFTAVIGRNGSGKSTLAKNMNALFIPTEGDIYVADINTKDEEHLWDIRQTCGMVFQNPDNQLVSSIVEDDVAFGPENIGVQPEEIRKRVDESLKAVGMYEFRKNAPHLLSGGQKQRIAIAGAIAMKPSCIVFDEPTAMLDPAGREDVIRIIEKLNAEGITVILITHFMEEAARADKVIVMDNGRIIASGTPREVFADPDKIRAIDLDVPIAVDVADRLRKKGFDVPENIVTQEELSEWVLS